MIYFPNLRYYDADFSFFIKTTQFFNKRKKQNITKPICITTGDLSSRLKQE